MTDLLAELRKNTGVEKRDSAGLSPVELHLTEAEQSAALRELQASAQNEIVQLEAELAEELAYRNRMFMVREISLPRETPAGLACVEQLLRAAIEKVEVIQRDLKEQRDFVEICDRKLFILQHK